MSEKAKRLTPLPETLRELFLKSGNLCAFPGCTELMMDPGGAFIGQVCHIEAAEEGGERFNRSMTNDDRRAAKNLMLMCYKHHVLTDDFGKYTVVMLQRFKSDHEGRFTNPQRAILAGLVDCTQADSPTFAANLRRMDRVLSWNSRDRDLKKMARSLREYVETLRNVPIETRNLLGKLGKRIHKMRRTSAVRSQTGRGVIISCADVEKAFRLDANEIRSRGVQLETYELGVIDEMSIGEDVVHGILVRNIDEWEFWPDLAEFCEKTNERMEVFTNELDFVRLDEDQQPAQC